MSILDCRASPSTLNQHVTHPHTLGISRAALLTCDDRSARVTYWNAMRQRSLNTRKGFFSSIPHPSHHDEMRAPWPWLMLMVRVARGRSPRLHAQSA